MCRNVQQQCQQQLQQMQRDSQAALDRQADSMRSLRHVSNAAMRRVTDKHSQRMKELRNEMQESRQDQLRQQIMGCAQCPHNPRAEGGSSLWLSVHRVGQLLELCNVLCPTIHKRLYKYRHLLN